MFVIFVLIWCYKASNSVTYFVITVDTICFSDEDFPFLLLFLVSCKWCMFIWYASLFLIGCAGSVGISLASRVMYIFCVCVSAVWSAVPVQFYLGISVVWAAGLYGCSFPLALQWRVRYGRIGEGGVVRFSFAFYSLLTVLLAVGCLR